MRRRKFIYNLAFGTIGIGFLGLPFRSIGKDVTDIFENGLKNSFLNPPDTAKPQTWWHWINGDINKEAITAELEAIKEIGLGGVQLFVVGNIIPVVKKEYTQPKVLCLSEEWHDMVQHALKECDRLNLCFSIQNCPGWSNAGGPWITPDKAMQHVVFSEHVIKDGQKIELTAPDSWPEKGATYYRDIAVLAFPTPEVYKKLESIPKPKITTNFQESDFTYLNENLPKNTIIKPVEINDNQSKWIQFEFPSPVTCRSVKISLGKPRAASIPDEHNASVWTSSNGIDYLETGKLSSFIPWWVGYGSEVTHAITPTKAKYFRLVWNGPAEICLKSIIWSARPEIYSLESKIGEKPRILLSEPDLLTEDGTAVNGSEIIDLTGQFDNQGKFSWKAPMGSWIVLRIGYRSLEDHNAPAPKEATGLECDKFNPETVAFHFNEYIGSVLKDTKKTGSKIMSGVVIDSWESSMQNWSPVMGNEFRKRCGYDILQWLPVFAGYIVDNREVTNRFLYDLSNTFSELVAENFYGEMTNLANQNGLLLYGEVPDILGAFHVDIPMATGGGNGLFDGGKRTSSASHLTGGKMVATEAFLQSKANWNDSPVSLKKLNDRYFCGGTTQIVFHTYTHNPDMTNIYPGPAFGNYGIPLGRGQTWWKPGSAWIKYMSRCQFMLKRGNSVADVLYWYGVEPAILEFYSNIDAYGWHRLPEGYDWDLLPTKILLNELFVNDNGLLEVPCGATYKLLVLRNSEQITTDVAIKIEELVKSGATVLGQKPLSSPGLLGYPKCDNKVKEIGDKVWGKHRGNDIKYHTYGKGKVFSNTSIQQVLLEMEFPPDFSYTSEDSESEMKFIHRCDGNMDIYFLSNQRNTSVCIEAAFRVNGKVPQLWDPVTGECRDAVSFYQENLRTFMPLYFDAYGSVFVVFEDTILNNTKGTAKNNVPVFIDVLGLDDTWSVSFTPGWGAPENTTFNKLIDWSKHSDPGIRYYSGTAVYRKMFRWDKTVGSETRIDLGNVAVIAQVKLNNIDCGTAWTYPYRLNITDALKNGNNALEIHLTNTWANRLIGDEQLPVSERKTWTTYHSFSKDSQPVSSGLIGPVKIQVADNNF